MVTQHVTLEKTNVYGPNNNMLQQQEHLCERGGANVRCAFNLRAYKMETFFKTHFIQK